MGSFQICDLFNIIYVAFVNMKSNLSVKFLKPSSHWSCESHSTEWLSAKFFCSVKVILRDISGADHCVSITHFLTKFAFSSKKLWEASYDDQSSLLHQVCWSPRVKLCFRGSMRNSTWLTTRRRNRFPGMCCWMKYRSTKRYIAWLALITCNPPPFFKSQPILSKQKT